MQTVTIGDGRQVTIDLGEITQDQAMQLATAMADFLVRSGQCRDDVLLTGPHLVQFMTEAADMTAAAQG